MKENTVPFHRHIISLICVAIISGGVVQMLNKPQLIDQTENDELAKVHTLFQNIQKDYYESVDPDVLIEGALQGMTEALDDPYTSYFNQEDSEAFSETLSGQFEGIGATLMLQNDLPVIAEQPAPESPAAQSGLQMDDQILRVDGKETKGESLSEIVSWIRGEQGTTVTLTIQRETAILDVEVTRNVIAIESVYGSIDAQHSAVGKIEIATFSENTAAELQAMIEKLRKAGATSFVLDLRGNPGGYLDQVERMASMFLADGDVIVQFGLKEEIVGEVRASSELDQGFKVTEPVVVLVDGGSASASEILAAALQESAGVPVVGMQTFGKGTVQGVQSLDEQSEIKLTIQKWLTPKGNWLNEVGVTPDNVVDFPEYAYYSSLLQDEFVVLGDTSEKAQELNQFLEVLGYMDEVEDTFNESTQAALSLFQEENELTVTGALDLETAVKLEEQLRVKLRENDPMYLKAIEVLLERTN